MHERESISEDDIDSISLTRVSGIVVVTVNTGKPHTVDTGDSISTGA